jgi:hypothetical protein
VNKSPTSRKILRLSIESSFHAARLATAADLQTRDFLGEPSIASVFIRCLSGVRGNSLMPSGSV